MLTGLPTPLGRICVLDIETSIDTEAIKLLAERRRGSENASALRQVVSASILSAMEDDGNWEVTAIDTMSTISIDHEQPSSTQEEDVLAFVDQQLADLEAAGGVLVTYNGVAHDLPILCRRAARHRLFEAQGLLSPTLKHLDLLHARLMPNESWPKLKELAASFGIPVAARLPRNAQVSAQQAKAEVDVCATFLVLVCELSLARQKPDAFYLGWRALGRYIREAGKRGEHLQQFARHMLGRPGPGGGPL
jgi:hypothetical protein